MKKEKEKISFIRWYFTMTESYDNKLQPNNDIL